MELGRIDAGRWVFVNEMGDHTSLGLLYVNAPVGERAFLEIIGNAAMNHHRGTHWGPSDGIMGGKGCPDM